MEYTLGKTAGDMMASTRTIRSMGSASMSGQMGVGTKETGRMGNKMGKAGTFYQMEQLKQVFGRTARERNGLNDGVNYRLNQ